MTGSRAFFFPFYFWEAVALDRFLAANGPKRQHQSRCCPLSSPLGAHLEMSLGFTAYYASSPAAVAPVYFGGCIMDPAGTFGAGESGPTSPRSDSHLAGFSGGVEPVHMGGCAAHRVTHFHGPSSKLRQI